jgi:hypothetical protein
LIIGNQFIGVERVFGDVPLPDMARADWCRHMHVHQVGNFIRRYQKGTQAVALQRTKLFEKHLCPDPPAKKALRIGGVQIFHWRHFNFFIGIHNHRSRCDPNSTQGSFFDFTLTFLPFFGCLFV